MSYSYGSKEAAAYLIDPMTQPEPSAETGPGSHFGSTFAPSQSANAAAPPPANPQAKAPPRKDSLKQPISNKGGVQTEAFPVYRADHDADSRRRAGSHSQTPPSYQQVTSTDGQPQRRRGSSLKERYPGDKSHKPLDVIKKDSKKAGKSPHLSKRHMPGADMIDRLDPALGGVAYHHEGPFDAALLARNTNHDTAPIAALETSNREALKATPQENIKDAVERHKPLDGVAMVPSGMPDQFGRELHYKEGADLMHEPSSADAGYKRWPGKDYDPEDLKGESEPTFSLDRALKSHNIDDNGIEMADRAQISKDYHAAERKGTLDPRDPVEIAGGDAKYVDMQNANALDGDTSNHHPLRAAGESLKKRIGSLRHRKNDD